MAAARIFPLMNHINKELFNKKIPLVALRVPTSSCNQFLKKLKGHLFDRPKFKAIIPDPKGDQTKLVLLNSSVKDNDLTGLSEDSKQFIQSKSIEITSHDIELTYDHYTTEEALKAILPTELTEKGVPTAFEIIGHVAHTNLRGEYDPYKYQIGQILLEKNPRLKTVVNKVGKIENQFRVFQMELLAGEENLETEIKESKCVFRFNFGEVYWNSRLQTEHDRIVNLFKANDVICDMFAGVGPFAIPAAHNVGCVVYANDLNPRSFHYLQGNAKLNKVSPLVHCYNMDARDFVRKIFKEGNAEGKPINITQVVMNLPASAVEFLDVFRGIFAGQEQGSRTLPTIHCYGFSNASDVKADIVKQVETVLGASIEPINVFNVRDVAPNKEMMCVSFVLPASVAFEQIPDNESSNNNNNNNNNNSIKRKQEEDSQSDDKRKRVDGKEEQ